MSRLHSLRRAFTLIELLVVIAIIGILSAVILASLNTARARGNDASVESNLNTILTQSVLYYDTNNGYGTANATTTTTTAGNACPATGNGIFSDPTIISAMKAATKSSGATTLFSVASSYMYCGSNAGYWEVIVPLSTNPANSWCVDSTGVSAKIPTSGAAGTAAVAC